MDALGREECAEMYEKQAREALTGIGRSRDPGDVTASSAVHTPPAFWRIRMDHEENVTKERSRLRHSANSDEFNSQHAPSSRSTAPTSSHIDHMMSNNLGEQ